MAFGTPGPGALQYPVVAPAAQQIAQAAHAAPQANADEAEKLAATQAQTQVDKTTGMEAELKQSQTQDAMLARLAAVPGIEQSPMGQKMLTERFKTLGVPVPKNELGQIDMKAVRAIITPPPAPWAQMTAKDKADFWTQRPEDRTIPAGAPEDANTRQAVTPLTEKGAEYLHTPVVRAEAALAAGHGNLQSLLMAARAEKAVLTAKGADTSSVDTILTPEGKLRPEYATQKANDLVQAQIDNLHSLGIYRVDEEKIKSRLADEKVREWNTESANTKAQVSQKQAHDQIMASRFAQQLDMSRQNLSARLQSVSNSSTANLLRAGSMGINMYEKRASAASTALKQSEDLLARTNGQLSQMWNANPNLDVTNPVYAGLVSQANALSEQINGNAQKGIPSARQAVEDAQAASGNGISSIYNQIQGNTGVQQPSITINNNPQPGARYGSSPAQGKTVVETRMVNGKSMSKFSDGSFGPTP